MALRQCTCTCLLAHVYQHRVHVCLKFGSIKTMNRKEDSQADQPSKCANPKACRYMRERQRRGQQQRIQTKKRKKKGEGREKEREKEKKKKEREEDNKADVAWSLACLGGCLQRLSFLVWLLLAPFVLCPAPLTQSSFSTQSSLQSALVPINEAKGKTQATS